MSESDIMVADQGATFYCFSVAMKLKKGQRAYTNGGFSALGYSFPAAVGSCFANNKRRVISVNGDGGFQMNIQEMQTVAHHNLPLKIFIFENQGYTSIKHTQMAYMDGFFVGSDPASGLSCPSTQKIAGAYGFPYFFVSEQKDLKDIIVKALNTEGPVVVEVKLDPIQEIRPRVSTKKLPDGRLLSKPLEDMYPFLPQEEFKANMIVKPVPEEG
jgi:acetolactate synthase-1/2/3 large subunit